jgi:hypothetical protein
MKLQQALKTSLDELRMQMLGVQVLFGFQFQGLFQDAFGALGTAGRLVDAVGLGLMLIAMGLMIAVPCQHRMVEGGETTPRIYRVSVRYALLALLPLAGGIGCDVFVATCGPFGRTTASLLSLVIFLLTLSAWYALGAGLRRRWSAHRMEVPMKSEHTPLHAKIEQMLTEARVILPGAQALLGFQLIVMLSNKFGQLAPAVRVVHLIALACLALTIILLICPAAVHRIALNGADDQRLHAAGSLLISAALLPLAAGLSCDLWVALTILFGQGSAALIGALAAFGLVLSLWFVMPLFLKGRLPFLPRSAPRGWT